MNKKTTYIGTTIIVLIFGILVLPKIFERLSKGETVENTRMSNVKNYQDVDIRKIGDMITLEKVPQWEFINQHNDTINNNYYTGKVHVIEFFFSTCPSICPIMNANMQKVQDAFSEKDNFGIASFSIDPTYDTPQVLKDYADAYQVTHPHWNFLTGDKAEILSLSNKGFKLFAEEDTEAEGGFSHSGMFALIDKEGNITCRIDKNGNPIFYYNGLEDEGIQMLIEDIKKIL